MASRPVPETLDAQHMDGYWVKSGGGDVPSYRATLWQIIFLADLGADPRDVRVQQGCAYLLDHHVAANGGFSMSDKPVPSSVVHCLNGAPLYALLRLGFGENTRVRAALDWQARAITGEEAIRYFKSGTTGPGFGCAYNGEQPCAWGATKALLALNAFRSDHGISTVHRALEMGAEFLLGHDLAIADYPHTKRVNATWFQFGFPLNYRCDVLETVEALVELGYRNDPRLRNALQFIASKQDRQGRWSLGKTLNGKMWADVEERGKPSKWITLKALRVLHDPAASTGRTVG